ncbi:SdpI family protein [Bacillus sp. MUM 13]|uniref:SdpI family protein n=1 Tax=Bacillus sp. MUM 13 TaxID=1678001 RepID=UPI0008F574A1|nr:SdpI family protein [Bacillus sp. MUM 13]OIK12498.1 hypothetical protein BIV59_08335 [Bacillus sp. MUM 13]
MKKHLIPIVIIGATVMLWLIFYRDLPGKIPVHWGTDGADGYGTKLDAMLMNTGMMILLYVILAFSPKLDPKKENYKYFKRSYGMITYCLLMFFFFINIFTILSGLGYQLPMSHLVTIFVGLLFIVIGNYTNSLKPNYFVGIKTPWTLSNETVWKKTHRFGSKTFMIAGVLLMASAFLPAALLTSVMIPIILAIALLPIVYSYFIFKKTVN